MQLIEMYLKHANRVAFAGKFPILSIISENVTNYATNINTISILLDVAEKLSLEKHHINF